jgi:hypothetical protein
MTLRPDRIGTDTRVDRRKIPYKYLSTWTTNLLTTLASSRNAYTSLRGPVLTLTVIDQSSELDQKAPGGSIRSVINGHHSDSSGRQRARDALELIR